MVPALFAGPRWEMTEETGKPRPLEDLDARIKAARAAEPGAAENEPRKDTGLGQGMGLGVRIGVELVAGLMVGTLIGWGLDRWLGTRPWLMIVFFFLGAAAAVMNVYRAARGLDDSVGLGQAQRRTENDEA